MWEYIFWQFKQYVKNWKVKFWNAQMCKIFNVKNKKEIKVCESFIYLIQKKITSSNRRKKYPKIIDII